MDDDKSELSQRLEQLEERQKATQSDVAEIKAALLGSVINGTTGLLGRVRDREQMAEAHELRIISLEKKVEHHVEKDEFRNLADRVEINTQWRNRVMWMLAGAAAAGGLTGGGIVAVLARMVGG